MIAADGRCEAKEYSRMDLCAAVAPPTIPQARKMDESGAGAIAIRCARVEFTRRRGMIACNGDRCGAYVAGVS